MENNKHYIMGISIMKAVNLMCFHDKRIEAMTPASMALFNEIFDLLQRIQAEGINSNRQLWFKIPRGTLADCKFQNEAEACDYFEIEDPAELQKAFEDWYPDEEYWLSVESAQTDNYRMLQVGKRVFLVLSEKESTSPSLEYDFSELLLWVKNGIVQTIKECEEGTYNDRIERELPYTLRHGVIQRKVLWDHRPDYRESNIKDLSQSEISEFVELLRQGIGKIPTGRIKGMTFNQYFEYAAKAFDAAGYRIEGASPYSLFQCYGEDFGGGILRDLDHDSPDDFYDYYSGKWRAGGHPWGLFRGTSRSRILLSPKLDDEGYYFIFSGDPNWSIYKIVKMYTALHHAGLPMAFIYPQKVISYLLEEDNVGFVTEHEMPVYCQRDFSENINDFYHYDPDRDEPLKHLVNWYPVSKIHLLNNQKKSVMLVALGYVRFEKSEDCFSKQTNKIAENIIRYCNHKGYPIMDLYRDLGTADNESRSEISYILTHLELPLFDVLIVDTVDQLSVNKDFLLRFVRTLNENGRSVYEVKRDIEITPAVIEADFPAP